MDASNVIETGDRRMIQVESWTLSIGTEPDAEPEIADADLAVRLGLPLHKFRQLSGRHEAAGNIHPRVSTTVVESKKGGRPATQRFYGEADALFLVTRSERPEAVALTKEMIRVYMLARRGLLAPTTTAHDPAILAAIAALSQQVAALSKQVATLQPVRLAPLGIPRVIEAPREHQRAPFRIDPESWRRKILSFLNVAGTLIFTPDGDSRRYGVRAIDLWRAAIRIPVSKIERRHAEAIYDIMASMRWEYVRKESVRDDKGNRNEEEVYIAPVGWKPRR
jgi:hypothetical protein